MFVDSVKEIVSLSNPRMDEAELFKDAEVAFSEAKYHSESESIGDEEIEDKASKENLGERQLD